MKIKAQQGNIYQHEFDALIIGCYEDTSILTGAAALLDNRTGGRIAKEVNLHNFKGKHLETMLLCSVGEPPASSILLVGLGKKNEFTINKLREAFGKGARILQDLRFNKCAASLNFGETDPSVEIMAEAAAEGILLALYRFNKYKTNVDTTESLLKECTFLENDKEKLKKIKTGIKKAQIISDAVYCTRNLVSIPSNDMTPSILAKNAQELLKSKDHLKITVFTETDIKRLKMKAFLGVSQGSNEPPRFIIIEYQGGKETDKPIVFVGKGITFDSGGISLKPSEKMDEMKTDMAGGAAVIGTMKAAAELQLPLNIIGIIPATENLPSGKAYKPGDILTSMSGKTIEVKNTDAEGRLILADALTYAKRYNPSAVIDIATLTGACIIALGENLIGMMGTDSSLMEELKNAADFTGEHLWELPLWNEYDDLIKSDIADIKNTGGRPGGTITAGLFLKEFTGKYPWVHLDIAGPSYLAKDKPYIPKGASGVGVRLFIDFLRKRTSKINEPSS